MKLKKDSDKLQVISFKINGSKYGVDILKVQEIIPSTKITKIPTSAPGIRGVFNYRGSVIPLLDLVNIMKLDGDVNGKTLLLVLNFNNQLIAVEVDTVEASKTYDWKDILPIDSITNSENPMFTDVIREDSDGSDLIILINFESILLTLGKTNQYARFGTVKSEKKAVENKEVNKE